MDAQLKDSGPRRALGRGLAALMPTMAPGAAPAATAPGLRYLPIERIHPNKKQPRKHFDETALDELASSIRIQGVLQPIVVRRAGSDYEIVAGERRWRAATQAGLHEIPAVIKELSDLETLGIALIENIQRQDLDPLEEAEAYGRLVREHGLTHDQVADAVGKSRSAITNSLRLIKLPEAVLDMLADGRLSPGHARALMMLETDAAKLKLANDILARAMPVREAERIARKMTADKAAPTAEAGESKSPSERQLVESLQRTVGAKVRLVHQDGKGRLEILFNSLDELDGILERLQGG